jgi:hypothetical protein
VPAQRDCKRFGRHSRAAAQLLGHDKHGVLLAVSGDARGVAASGVHGFEVAAELHGYIQIKNFVMVAVASQTENTILGFAVSVLSKTHTA